MKKRGEGNGCDDLTTAPKASRGRFSSSMMSAFGDAVPCSGPFSCDVVPYSSDRSF